MKKTTIKPEIQNKVRNLVEQIKMRALTESARKEEKALEMGAKIKSRMVISLLSESMTLLEVDAPVDITNAPPSAPSPAAPGPAGPPPDQSGGMDMTPPAASPDSNSGDPNDDQNQITLEKVIAKLNTIRGGKSLRDPSIYNKLNVYYDALQETEKSELYKFLSGIAQVITDIVPTAQQPEVPAAPPGGEPTPPPPEAPPATPAPSPAGQPTPVKVGPGATA